MLTAGLGRLQVLKGLISSSIFIFCFTAATLHRYYILHRYIAFRFRSCSTYSRGLVRFRIDWRGKEVPVRMLGREGEWIVRSQIGLREERNILYKGVETSL